MDWMGAFARLVGEHAVRLTELDRQIGDADHGSNMDRGMKAVLALDAASQPDAVDYLKKAGMTLVGTVGGAAGPLYGTFLLRFASALPAGDRADSPAELAAAWRGGLDGVVSRGKSGLGDKTMVDVLQPAVEAMEAGHEDVASCLQAGLEAAREGLESTRAMVARKGRASYLGERSAGHLDPGAASAVLLLEAALAAQN
ncbi:dihydroxyacetone kinase subunit DhaL [Luteococcus sediminum]|uniref:dihydroxyacetone kinase subunit DhaL n=1 Tax=Luteococcus sp. TaxID=1969402 RepID=UPI003735D2B0